MGMKKTKFLVTFEIEVDEMGMSRYMNNYPVYDTETYAQTLGRLALEAFVDAGGYVHRWVAYEIAEGKLGVQRWSRS